MSTERPNVRAAGVHVQTCTSLAFMPLLRFRRQGRPATLSSPRAPQCTRRGATRPPAARWAPRWRRTAPTRTAARSTAPAAAASCCRPPTTWAAWMRGSAPARCSCATTCWTAWAACPMQPSTRSRWPTAARRRRRRPAARTALTERRVGAGRAGRVGSTGFRNTPGRARYPCPPSLSRPRLPLPAAAVEQVLDPRTRMVLFKMLNRGVFSEINGCVSTGKEANVYHARWAAGEGPSPGAPPPPPPLPPSTLPPSFRRPSVPGPRPAPSPRKGAAPAPSLALSV